MRTRRVSVCNVTRQPTRGLPHPVSISYDWSIIMSVTAPIVAFYDYALQPISALTWVGAPISALDIAGALRLALILRQVREQFHKEHLAKAPLRTTGRVKDGRLEKVSVPVVVPSSEQRSRVRNFAASLVMVFGGEAVVGALKICWLLRHLDPIFHHPNLYSTVARLAAHVLGLRRCPLVVSERQCAS